MINIAKVLASVMMFVLTFFSAIIGAAVPFNYPGGVAEIILPKQNQELPIVRFGTQEPAILEYDDYWRILIGIDLQQLPGEYLVYTRQNGENDVAQFKKINVDYKAYSVINNQNESVIKLSQYTKLSELDFKNSQPPKLPMTLPFIGSWDTNFGQLSISSSDKSTVVQNYTFVTAPENTLIRAPQDGIISKIVTQTNGTSTVMIDHGRSIISIIHGLGDLAVKIGDGIVSQAVIAKVPSDKSKTKQKHNGKSIQTAKKTVFWQVQLNGVFVNPLILTML